MICSENSLYSIVCFVEAVLFSFIVLNKLTSRDKTEIARNMTAGTAATVNNDICLQTLIVTLHYNAVKHKNKTVFPLNSFVQIRLWHDAHFSLCLTFLNMIINIPCIHLFQIFLRLDIHVIIIIITYHCNTISLHVDFIV